MTTNRQLLLALTCSLAYFILLTAGCPPEAADRQAAFELNLVFITNSDLLEAPAVPSARKFYRPVETRPINPATPDSAQAAAFYLTVTAQDPHTVRFRFVNEDTGYASDLQKLATPPSAPTEPLPIPAPPDTAARNTLATGRGIFWLHDAPAGNDSLEARFAIIAPLSQLSPATRLVAYASIDAQGNPLGTDEIALVPDFFYMAVIGDSIQWGNGLLEADKISTLVRDTIEQQTAQAVILQRYAHSGARIVPAPGDGTCAEGCSGEVPTASTSITAQAELISHPELMDLILMDGCINDIGIFTIVNPNVTEEMLTPLIDQFCNDEMANLLRHVHTLAPQAHIVVTGYYQIVGPDSDLLAFNAWAVANGIVLAPDDPAFDTLVANSELFTTQSSTAIQSAVEQVNAEIEGEEATLAFADPQFGPAHALFTDDSWLWNLVPESNLFEGLAVDLALFPEDPLTRFRFENCFEEGVISGGLGCLYASVGHPNPTGAQVYADTIITTLQSLGILP